jgi:fermentation-respiration switch protein FrsA (DUF1100 family)
MRGARELALALLALALLAALAGCLLVRFERLLLFPGARAELAPDALERVGGESVWLEHAAGRSEAFWLPAHGLRGAAPLLVFAHGNAELIDHWLGEWEPLRGAGLSVLLVEYPGYGRSEGRTSEHSVTEALRAAYDWSLGQPGVDAERVVGYGRSVGGGAVCQLARERRLAALVLESTFTSVRDVARGRGFPGFLVADAFESLEVVRRFAGALLVVHGERDEIVPFSHAEALHAAAPGSELLPLPCGHNDCPRPWRALLRFLSARGLLRPGDAPPG